MEQLLSVGRLPATLSELAREAGMSTATAYRHFQSLDEVSQAYLVETMTKLREQATVCEETGFDLLHAVSRFWIAIVQEHGGVLVQIRSRRGFYDRMRQGVASTELGFEARRRALTEVLAELGLPASMLEDAAMLYNTMFDPRDIIDLISLRGLDPERATKVLVSSFVGALKGWQFGLTDAADLTKASKDSAP